MLDIEITHYQILFNERATRLASLNHMTFRRASAYLHLLGETLEVDEDGLAVVRDPNATILARLRLPE
jgi:hypothetical protein